MLNQPIRFVFVPHLGLCVLSSCVKKIGADCSLCDLTTVPVALWAEVLEARLRRDRPDLVAVTASTMHWPYVEPLVRICKKLAVPHVIGGPHPSSDPEGVMQTADALVVGEGEGAMMDIVRALANDRPIVGIPNTCVRTSAGRVVETPRRNLIEDLDDLPFPDWKLLDGIHFRPRATARGPGYETRNLIRATIEGSRGCPYTCTYCSNSASMKDYRGKGTWRREKSVPRIIEEIKACRETLGGLHRLLWADEVFMTSTQRVRDFAEAYKREIDVPFDITERPEIIDEEKIKLLADAGLDYISIGFESGDERIRKAVLNRKTKLDVIKQAFLLPMKYGVRTHSFTMVGLPGQDEQSMLLTWKFLREIKPDSAQFTVFRPMRGTVLYDECVARGMYDPKNDTRLWAAAPIIKHDLLDDDTIMRYQRMLTQYAVRRGLWPVIAFHLGRRSNRICAALGRSSARWSRNRLSGVGGLRNAWDVFIDEVRSWRGGEAEFFSSPTAC